MDSKDEYERGGGGGGGSGGDGSSFVHGVDHIDDESLTYLFDAAHPRDVELEAAIPVISSGPPPSTTQPPLSSNNSNDAWGATVPMDEENIDHAPRPPAMIAESVVWEKEDIIEDIDAAPVPGQQVAASVEVHGDEEERWEEVDDDEAYCSPAMIAASVVWEKVDIIEDGDAAPFPGQKDGDEEERWEEVDDEEAPRPPAMIAASLVDDAEQEANKRPPKLQEEIEETPPATVENTEILLDPSSSSSQPISTIITANMRVSAISINPIPRRGDEPSLPVKTTISPARESMPPPRPNLDRNNHSLPLLEAILVDDEVYDAFPVSHDRGWSRQTRKYMILGLVSFGFVTVAAVTGVAVVLKGNQNEGTALTPTMSPITASPSAPWIWEQQGQPIAGDAENDLFGRSVAMSADAKTLVIGATGSNNNTGYVTVYHTNDDGWSSMQLIGQSIFGEAVYDYFGSSVSVSSDGKILAIGAPGNMEVNDRPGYVRVFYLESDFLGSSWKQLGQDITGDADGDQFGESVSLSDDGKTLAVGANCNGGNGDLSGYVRIYHLEDDGTSWEQIGQDIYGEAAGNSSGSSVSLSADGTTVAIGAPGNDGNGEYSGQVRVYQIDSAGSTWGQLGQDINGEAAYDMLGWSVDISPDGRTLAIGASGYWEENDRPGYVRVYYLESNDLTSSWKQLGQDIIGEAVGDEFGRSISLSGDGKTLAIGARVNDGVAEDAGHVRVYRMDDSSTSWTQVGEDIDGKAGDDNSGRFVSLSADGTTVAIGAPFNDDNGLESGHVRIFSVK